MKLKLILSILLLVSSIEAQDSKESTLTDITFNMDDDGNLNPTIFLPIYYGESNQFYSAIGYTSTNSKEVATLDEFEESKNAFISSSKNLHLNYITYKTSLFGLDVSIGAESTISDIENNEFGYLHDSENLLGQGSDYYLSFDNEIELDQQRHAIKADILLPFGDYFTSRVSTSISPYTTIKVKQSSLFKPLIEETGTSSSSTVQDIAYSFKYEAQVKTGTFIDIGFIAAYNKQPIKYDIAQIRASGDDFIFKTTTIDTDEITTSYLVKLIFDIEIMGKLNPSFGYGVKNFDRKNNISGESTSTDKKIFSFGVEKRF